MLPWERVRHYALAAAATSDSKLVMGVCGRLQRTCSVELDPRRSKGGGTLRSAGDGGGDPSAFGRGSSSRSQPGSASVDGQDPSTSAASRRAFGTSRRDLAGDQGRDSGASCGPSGNFSSRMAQRANGLIMRAGSPQQALAFMAKHSGNDVFYRALGAAAARRWPLGGDTKHAFHRTFINVELDVDGDGDEVAHLIECCLPAGTRTLARSALGEVVTNSLDWYGELGRSDLYTDERMSQGVCAICARVWEAWGFAAPRTLAREWVHGLSQPLCDQ